MMPDLFRKPVSTHSALERRVNALVAGLRDHAARPKLRALLAGAVLILLAAPAAAQTTRTPADVAAAMAKDPMVFYLAKGEPDACGPGCSEWIAAEGHIDVGAPQRLRTVLASLGKRKLPVFFHSPGGLGWHATEIGRLLRKREMTTGVSRTLPAGCAAASEESCRALKRSGQPLQAELSSLGVCNSACVLALIGGKIRQVPPGARIGVHSAKPVLLQSNGVMKAVLPGRVSAESAAQTRRYHQEMQIAAELFDLGAKVPHEQIHYLSRDEIAKFGIDKREFLETRWLPWQQAGQRPAAVKFIVETSGTGRKQFRLGLIKLACVAPRRVWIAYLRGSAPDGATATKSFKLALGERDVAFPQKGAVSKIESLETGSSFETRHAYAPLDLVEAVAARESVDLVEVDQSDPATGSRSNTLSTIGLAKALEALQKECGQHDKFFDAPAVRFPDLHGMSGKP
jgi:hypothetical protein